MKIETSCDSISLLWRKKFMQKMKTYLRSFIFNASKPITTKNIILKLQHNFSSIPSQVDENDMRMERKKTWTWHNSRRKNTFDEMKSFSHFSTYLHRLTSRRNEYEKLSETSNLHLPSCSLFSLQLRPTNYTNIIFRDSKTRIHDAWTQKQRVTKSPSKFKT